MAASLAASIKDHFDIEPALVEGHDGIFEVAINAQKVYTNNSECSILPETMEILEHIHLHGGTPLKPLSSASSQELSLDGAACPLPTAHFDIKPQLSIQHIIKGLHDENTAESDSGDCGCGCKS